MSQSAQPPPPKIRNNILCSLAPDEMERLAPHLKSINLAHGDILFDVGDTIDLVYFPNEAMISVVASTVAGQTAESGVIGWEGVGGVEVLMGDPQSLNRHIIQLPGEALAAPTAVVQAEFARGGNLQRSTLAFVRALIAQMSQTVLCNRLHIAEKRLAKWLLMCHDRAPGDVLHITQEFAALMLGSNRVSVTQAAIQLQDRSLIEYTRGRITIVDREGLETFCCECYERIKDEFVRVTS